LWPKTTTINNVQAAFLKAADSMGFIQTASYVVMCNGFEMLNNCSYKDKK